MSARPSGSNADEWHLFLTEHLDNRSGNNGLTYMAVQIAEAIEAGRITAINLAEATNACNEQLEDARKCREALTDLGNKFIRLSTSHAKLLAAAKGLARAVRQMKGEGRLTQHSELFRCWTDMHAAIRKAEEPTP